MWRSDLLYKSFYYKSGLVWVNNQGLLQTIIDNYKKLKATDRCWLIKPKKAKVLWDGIHANADYDEATDMLLN